MARYGIIAVGVIAWPHAPEWGKTFICCFCKTEKPWREGMVAASGADGQRFACRHHLSADRLFVAVFANYLVQNYEQDWQYILSDLAEGGYEQNLY